MSKKRKNYRLSSSSTEKKIRNKADRAIQHRLENNILAYLYSSEKPVTFRALYRALAAQKRREDDINPIINSLLSKKYIQKNEKKHLTLNRSAPLYIGNLEKNPKGFGFVTTPTPYLSAAPLAKDPYISASRMNSAIHGDRLLIRITRIRNDNRPEGEVVKILSHGRDTIAGFYFPQKQGSIVHPEDPRFPFHIKVEDSAVKPHEGDAVIVRIKRDRQSSGDMSGEIIELLGSPDNIDVQMRLVIEKFSLPHRFSDHALREAEKLSESFKPSKDRLDLRKVEHITIDGETAKDFDDAVYVKKTPEGFLLYVSIADVSYFVRAGSDLDKEAYARGTSIYFPGRVIPMLPENLSNDLCSLVPGKDRFTVTAILKFDHNGKLLKKEFTRSVIRSHHRFTYTTVKQILIDKDSSIQRLHKPFLTQLESAYELATALYAKRKKRGSIGFTLPETEITLTDNGEIATISTLKRNFAHQIIEEFMLAANEAVAELFSQNKSDALYRIHERPDVEKIKQFCIFAKTLDLHLTKADNRPEWFAGVVEQCKGTKTEYLVNNLLLRTMKQARYSPDNAGHFGLASSDYTHFTSPIRRYPDLLVHRELIRTILKDTTEQKEYRRGLRLQEKGEFLSARERVAIRAEREMNERLKVRYMQKRIGESFDGIISGVNDFAMFVELKDRGISGSIQVKDLKDDYYLHDEKRYRLIGELSGTIYQMGDSIRVTLLDVDYQRNRINFVPS
ncbi:MAG: ribonuclease R [Deltaproteobacteria bacterium]|nr:ribonuclease R [Deltaproteobacteria bacterium]